MYGNSGMFPSYGYNQSPFQSILTGVDQIAAGAYNYYNPPTQQPTFLNTYNQGMFSGTSGVVVLGLIVLVVVLLVK